VVDDARAAVSEHEPVATEGRQIRHSLRTLLTGWGLGEDAVGDAQLVVEELVANVVDHVGTPFQLVVRLTGRVLRVAVRDGSRGLPQVRPFNPHAARGRGLQVIAALAQHWGYDCDDRGKTVWVDLAV
jgi:anti-sigma regulatory factor (Ser/Thr protein kinase)